MTKRSTHYYATLVSGLAGLLVAISVCVIPSVALAKVCRLPVSESANAVQLKDGQLLPLAVASGGDATAFVQDGRWTTAFNARGKQVWRRTTGVGKLISGFDLDNDSHVDFALAKAAPLNRSCGRTAVHESWIEVYSGRTAKFIASTTRMPDKCHTHLNYATRQWESNTVLFGGRQGSLALAPQYASTGWFWSYKNGKVQQNAYHFPSTATFNRFYSQSQKILDERGRPDNTAVAGSHVQNGLIVSINGDERLVMFTTGRVLQYNVGRLDTQQLLAERLLKKEPGQSGRNYGQVGQDPQNESLIALVAGTSIHTVWSDMVRGKIGTDRLGGIERHVTVYDASSNLAWRQSFGSALIGSGGAYEGRIVFPGAFFLPTSYRSSSIGYNLFRNGTWSFHVTMQGSSHDALRKRGIFVWDVRDIDMDGRAEVIASRTRQGPGTYFPEWNVLIYSWDPRDGAMSLIKEIKNALPYVGKAHRSGRYSSSSGHLHGAYVGTKKGHIGLFTKQRAGGVGFVDFCRVRDTS